MVSSFVLTHKVRVVFASASTAIVRRRLPVQRVPRVGDSAAHAAVIFAGCRQRGSAQAARRPCVSQNCNTDGAHAHGPPDGSSRTRAVAYHRWSSPSAHLRGLTAQRHRSRRRPGQAHALRAPQGAAPARRAGRSSRTCSHAARDAVAARRSPWSSGTAPTRCATALAAPDVRFVVQDPPRGTGDAIRVGARRAARGRRHAGHHRRHSAGAARRRWRRWWRRREAGQLAVLTAKVPDPDGLGRIVRDAARSRARDRRGARRCIPRSAASTRSTPA